MPLNRGSFSLDDLDRVPPPARPVVLKSGGPVMDLVCTEGDNGVCEWDERTGTETKRERWILPLVCLYECGPVTAQQD